MHASTSDREWDEMDEMDLRDAPSMEELMRLLETTVPAGVTFFVNGVLLTEGTKLTEALQDAAEGFCGDYGLNEDEIEEDECYGCQANSNARRDHMGPTGCMRELGGGCC